MNLNTHEDKKKLPDNYVELYENEYFTIYEDRQKGYPFIHTLIYKFNKSCVQTWIEAIEDIGLVLGEGGDTVMATTPFKDNTAVIKVAKKAGFHTVKEADKFVVMVRDL